MTGTDTGVGKTAVACGILQTLRRRGLDLGAFKPAESGFEGRNGHWPTDGRCLAESAGLRASRNDVVPYVFREPLAPMVAASLQGIRINAKTVDSAFERMRRAHALTVVEGAGGLMVPLTQRLTMAHLARRWRLPLLVVARPGLGTINHTVLTVEQARNHGIDLLGIVINNYPHRPGTAEKTNPQVVERMTGVPVLGIVPRRASVDVEAGRVDPMRRLIEEHVDLDPITNLIHRGR